MNRPQKTVYAGALLFSGSTLLILAMMVAEALYPKYSTADNYISDLGVGSTAAVFNTAIIVYGACILAAAFLLRKDGTIPAPALFVLGLSGSGAACVGLFPETLGIPHYISAGAAFIGGAVAALLLSRSVHGPFRYLSALLGCVALAGLVLHISHMYIGLGPGGTERLIAYPLMLWSAGFGGYLMAQAGELAAE